MPSAEIARLGAGKYLSLTTFKRDGTAVATPVWVAADGDHLYVITDPTSGKAKRLRNSGRVRLAPCGMRGKVTGPAVEGTARLLDDPADIAATAARIKARYGWQYSLNEWIARRRGGASAGTAIEITVGA